MIPPTSSGLRTGRLLGVVASLPLLTGVVVVCGLRTPHYSHLADTVSRLASSGQPCAGLARTGFVLYGLLVVAGAGAVGTRVPTSRPLVSWLVAGYAAAAVVAGLAPKDLPGPIHTRTSQVHVLATVAGGALIVTAMALVARRSSNRGARVIAAWTAGFTVVASIVFRFSWGSMTYGLVERLLLAASGGWVASLAIEELAGDDIT